MEELFKEVATKIALGVELVAALVIAYGAVEAVVGLLIPRRRFDRDKLFHKRRLIFLRFGVWLNQIPGQIWRLSALAWPTIEL